MRNMNDILRQAQVMQNKIAKLQQEMGEHSYEASSGGGMDPKALEGNDFDMLQDLILAAVNEAGRIARETMEREMSSISGGIKLPGLF